jgi:transposase
LIVLWTFLQQKIEPFWETIGAPGSLPTYDSNALIQHIQEQHGTPVIPPRQNRKNPRDYDKRWYRERHLIEGFLGQRKHFRRLFSRFDKSAQAFLSFLHIVGALISIK